MSAASWGDKLLAEVQEENLDELLRSLHFDTASLDNETGIAPLDSIVEAFKNPATTRQQEVLYQQHEPPKPPSVRAPTVIEITGSCPCSGKTQLMYYSICIALLPAAIEGCPIQGKEQAVVLFDLGGNLSILRLRDIMHDYIVTQVKKESVELEDTDVAKVVSRSLIHLHAFTVSSTESLLSCLSDLPNYFLSQPFQHFSSNRSLGMLAIMDLSTFFYQDRQEAAEAALQGDDSHIKVTSDGLLVERHRSLVQRLRDICHTFSCVVIATNISLSATSTVMSREALRPHLPAVWNSFCTVRLVSERCGVQRVRPKISIRAAATERQRRLESLQKSGYMVWVNWWGAEDWREDVRQAVGYLDQGGTFRFHITAGGVNIGTGGAESLPH